MPTYIQFDTEQEAMDASSKALEFADEKHVGATTQYLFAWREDVNGKWWLIAILDDPVFAKYQDKWLNRVPINIKNKWVTTTTEPEWMPEAVV